MLYIHNFNFLAIDADDGTSCGSSQIGRSQELRNDSTGNECTEEIKGN